MKTKYKLISFTVAAILLFTGVYFIFQTNNENKHVSNVIKLINNEEYNNALNEISSKNIEKYTANNKDKLEKLKEMLVDFIPINNNQCLREKLISLDSFKNKYDSMLSDSNLKDFLKIINSDLIVIKDSIALMDSKKQEIVNADFDKSQELLLEYEKAYPLEDLSELRLIIEKKQIAKEQENKKIIGIGNTNASKNSCQIITVVSTGVSNAEVTLWEYSSDNTWNSIAVTYGRLGSNGMKKSDAVYEMDLCTPTGIYTLKEAFGISNNPGTLIPYRVLDGSEYWVDDENSKYYNTMQFGEANGRWISAEHLKSYTKAYDYSVVIDYNRYPIVPGKSSAIFLHCDTGNATLGCVAVDEKTMIDILKWLDPSKNPQIILDFSYENIYNNY